MEEVVNLTLQARELASLGNYGASVAKYEESLIRFVLPASPSLPLSSSFAPVVPLRLTPVRKDSRGQHATKGAR